MLQCYIVAKICASCCGYGSVACARSSPTLHFYLTFRNNYYKGRDIAASRRRRKVNVVGLNRNLRIARREAHRGAPPNYSLLLYFFICAASN